MQDKDDLLIKKMAKLLKEGATMLDKSCPKCGTLIYRLPNKKIICPSCNSEIIIQKEKKKTSTPVISSKDDFSGILKTLYTKIVALNQQLEQQYDVYQVEKLLQIINQAVQLYEKIQNMSSGEN
jgi:UPF0148 protein